MKKDVSNILKSLHDLKNEDHAKSLEYFGIQAGHVLGIRLPQLRKLAKEIGKDNVIASALWKESMHECKLLATLIAEPKTFSSELAEEWVADLYSWDVCDQLCCNLLWKTSYAWQLPDRWSSDAREFVRRAGIVMIAQLCIHQKKASDEDLRPLLTHLETYATDERNFVKKAVNWALREIGKRKPGLYQEVIDLCAELSNKNSKSARWIAADAIRELKKESTLKRLELLKQRKNIINKT